jgi:hypothetical protein
MRRTQKAGPGPAAQSQEHDPLRSPADRKPLARYGAMEGALARGFFHLDHVEPGCCCGTSDAGWRPGVAFTQLRQYGDQFFMSPDSKPALSAPPDPKMIRSRARTGTADAPCFQRVISLFSLCYLLLEKSSKSLIPLSDCPFVLNRLPVFLENLPVSGKKQGASGQAHSVSAADSAIGR